MKKNKLLIVLLIIGVCCAWVYIYLAVKENKTVANMALDESNTIITGIWDSDHVSKYNSLVIPDATIGYGYGAEYMKVTTIGEAAFQGNIWIKSVYIPANIITIQKNAFSGCNAIKEIQYGGTEQQWKKISVDVGNDVLKNVTVKYNASMPETGDY